MEYTAPVLPMKELRALLSEAAWQKVDKVFALYPFEFVPQVLSDARWRRSPYLGRYLVTNFKKGWFVYLFWGVNVAVFAVWQYPSLLDLPSKLFSSSQTRQQRPAKSGRSSRRLPDNVRTIHDLTREHEEASLNQAGLQPLYRHFMVSLDNIAQGRWWTMLTSTVSHKDFSHLCKNMLAFIGVASIGINRGLSNGKLFCVCLGSAVAGSVAHLWHSAHKAKRARQNRRLGVIRTAPALGASGIVSGLSVAVAVVFPYETVHTGSGFLPIPLTIPLWTIPFGSFAYDLWMLGDESSRIGHAAHLGGAVFGGLYSLAAWRGLSFIPWRL
ncbi:hypothetical protein QBC45DRAFT_420405 [Copromyces sp. CBS 386.78]|nr:hypothetical protein QBC45DRAFT_420405 [Copromyces sp. CBS 386.78]